MDDAKHMMDKAAEETFAHWACHHCTDGRTVYEKGALAETPTPVPLGKVETEHLSDPVVRGWIDAQKRGEDTDTRMVDFVASTEDVDRDGDVIRVQGWDVDEYRKNPVILWAHDYSLLPIGKAVKVWREDAELKVRVFFAPEDANPDAETA